MLIALFASLGNAAAEACPRLLKSSQTRQSLACLEVARHIFRRNREQLPEATDRFLVIAFANKLHGQAVAQEGVVWLSCQHLLQLLSAVFGSHRRGTSVACAGRQKDGEHFSKGNDLAATTRKVGKSRVCSLALLLCILHSQGAVYRWIPGQLASLVKSALAAPRSRSKKATGQEALRPGTHACRLLPVGDTMRLHRTLGSAVLVWAAIGIFASIAPAAPGNPRRTAV